MNIEDLHNQLKELGIPSEGYYLHGLYGSTDDNDKLALLSIGGEYEVYFKERGIKNIKRRFQKENMACEYFLQRMKDEFKNP